MTSTPGDLAALLLDLEHDLGKHLRLPLALLPREAAGADVRAALADALLRTRSSPLGVTTARELWRTFLAEAGAPPPLRSWQALVCAVEAALAWEVMLGDGKAPLDRAAVEAALASVGGAIRAVREELDGV